MLDVLVPVTISQVGLSSQILPLASLPFADSEEGVHDFYYSLIFRFIFF
jgi:hypothetical protein